MYIYKIFFSPKMNILLNEELLKGCPLVSRIRNKKDKDISYYHTDYHCIGHISQKN